MQVPSPLFPTRRVDEFFASRHGYRLCSTKWLPPDGVEIRGALCFCHGYTDYLGPHFDHIATLFSYNGFVCFGVEHRGHGRSDGLAAYIPDFQEVVTDYLDWLSLVRKRVSLFAVSTTTPALPIPIFVWAESMGGAIAVQVSCY